MPMNTLSKVVVIPNEYKERMDAGHFDPSLNTTPNYADNEKPVIYVTDPDNQENQLWAPPVQERNAHNLDEDSDDDTCSSCSPTYDEKDEVSVSSQTVQDIKEMSFYRTGWQNRIVRAGDDGSDRMLYYADIPWRAWGTSLSIRRGSREGPVIADVRRVGPGRPFEISFLERAQSQYIDGGVLVLKFGCIYSRTHKFVYRGRELAWTHGLTTRRLKDLKTGEVLAEFNSKCFSLHMDGRLVFLGEYARDLAWVDVIVVTALTCQQREREIRRNAQHGGGGGGGC